VAGKAGLAGILVILVGLLFRSVGTYLSLIGTPLDWKEKLFCVVSYIPKATVQAAIGAVPLAAGVASGEVILAVAVLSILLSAPIGAIGIMVMGEKILDHGDRSAYRFKELREKMELPHVGERIINKRLGSVWKVIEEKEIWTKDGLRPEVPGGSGELIPAIQFCFWQEDTSNGPGTGKTVSQCYSQQGPSFKDHWEILYDW
jgi:hypothetical protein